MGRTGVYYIDALIRNNLLGGLSRWGNGTGITNISYGFMTGGFPGGYFWDKEGMSDFRPFNQTQIDAAKRALDEFWKVSNVTFEDKGWNDGDLYFGTANFNNPNIFGRAYSPGQDFGLVNLSGDIWLNHQVSNNFYPTSGSKGFQTLLHEIGHALGLKHSFEGDDILPAGEDNYKFSTRFYLVMIVSMVAREMIL